MINISEKDQNENYMTNLPEGQEKLFSTVIQSDLDKIRPILKGINSKFRNTLHLRASVKMNWVETHNKREAQSMIGHKFVSSTEHFESQDTRELSELLDKYHLFGG